MSESPYIPEAVSQFRDLALEAMPDESELSLETARQYCKHLATHHYENFSVVSWFLPGELRPHFYNVYAYCRWSDDLADETGDSAVSLELLDWWNKELNACFQGNPRHPVFVALADTIRMFDIPITPFQNLLTAFRQDQCVTRYETYEDLQGYCRNSANPVGHLVLYLSGYRDEERRRLSDATCTALQLANFWQDVTLDLQKGRIYLPLEDMARFGYSEEALQNKVFSEQCAELMRFEVERTRALFEKGLKLCDMVNPNVRADLDLFNRGGLAILDMIKQQGYDVLTRRPSLSRTGKISLMLRYAIKRLLP